MVRDLRKVVADRTDYPSVLLFYQGSVDEGAAFFSHLWPEARAVSDEKLHFYGAFGIERGGWRQTVGPQVVACGFRATMKGNVNGRPVGDPWLMPGLFLVQGSQVLWQHDFAHVGDHPEWASLAERAMSAVGN